MGVRMQTFLIQSRGIEALHYNADARLLLIKYSSGDIRSFTRISPQACDGCSAPAPKSMRDPN